MTVFFPPGGWHVHSQPFPGGKAFWKQPCPAWCRKVGSRRGAWGQAGSCRTSGLSLSVGLCALPTSVPCGSAPAVLGPLVGGRPGLVSGRGSGSAAPRTLCTSLLPCHCRASCDSPTPSEQGQGTLDVLMGAGLRSDSLCLGPE